MTRTVPNRGATLIELVLSMAVAAILLTAMVSVVVMAARAFPNPNDAPSCVTRGSRVLDRMVSELETATLVLEQTPTAVTFLVPARGGDTKPERIRYSWGGVSGQPLTRQYNQGPAVTLIDAVDQFSLTPTVAVNTENYPGVATEDAAESLLVDYSAATGIANLNVTSSNWQGQVFGNSSWGAGVVGWRPTRVQFQAKQSGLLGVTNVQITPALVNLTPAPTTLAQTTVAGSGLLSSYGWQSSSFGGLDRFAPAASVCLVVQWAAGLPNSMVVQDNNLAGLVQTTNSGSTWSYHSDHALVSQMYGKLTRSSPTQCALSKYLCALTVNLRAGGNTVPATTTTAQTLNHPEMLSAFWELKFDRDPTTADVNADGAADWAVHGGGSFNAAGLLNLTWQPSSSQLDSQPGDSFSRLTVLDLRCRATAAGSWVGFTINAARSGSACAPVLAQLALQSDGTQTLTAWRKLNDATTDTLLNIPGLPFTPCDLHFVIDPAAGSVGICVNAVEYGAFAYNQYPSGDASQSVSLQSSGSGEFDYVRVREAMP